MRIQPVKWLRLGEKGEVEKPRGPVFESFWTTKLRRTYSDSRKWNQWLRVKNGVESDSSDGDGGVDDTDLSYFIFVEFSLGE